MSGWGTVVGALGGFVAAVMPEVFSIIRERGKHKRELEIKEAELDAAKAGYESAIDAQKDEIESLKAQVNAAPSAAEDDDCQYKWLVYIRSSVRPIVTYLFFFLFAIVKLVSLVNAYYVEHLSVLQALPALWDDETETLFSAVISFWFGSRALSRNRGTNNGSGTKLQSAGNLNGSARVVGE